MMGQTSIYFQISSEIWDFYVQKVFFEKEKPLTPECLIHSIKKAFFIYLEN